MVKRFLKGAFRANPSKPRYKFTWDPAIVLQYIESMGPNERMNIEQLGKKLLTLLALTTAHRVQTFSLIKTENIIQGSTEIQILIPDTIKTSNPNNFQPILRVPFYDENVNIYVGRTLLQYLKQTKDIRVTNELFITHKKPHRRASTQTLSRWIKEILRKSGIDTNKYKAHSTRHASTSAANRAGVNLDEIRKTAGWTEKSVVFAKFYNRSLVNISKLKDTLNIYQFDHVVKRREV
ncbi:hypothetical protein NQ315_014773 [Exocentrus adspersus]|uniref:Tyr recombinase domain-containing protein n=1 Tax=Exocentrus adspersus TaxID=1586481 RepID=A0AAV8VN57_9CUCU|nr:hypothetical protein NQ315_014773 [Exocentrus adspersus]